MTQESQKKVLFTIILLEYWRSAPPGTLKPAGWLQCQIHALDSFGPIATGFIGTLPGIIAVFLAQLTNFILHGR